MRPVTGQEHRHLPLYAHYLDVMNQCGHIPEFDASVRPQHEETIHRIYEHPSKHSARHIISSCTKGDRITDTGVVRTSKNLDQCSMIATRKNDRAASEAHEDELVYGRLRSA